MNAGDDPEHLRGAPGGSGVPASPAPPGSPGAADAVDVIVIGAGGAGMMCAAEAGKRGRRVRLVDHAAKLGGKILISGGGRCNFTNTGAGPGNYVSRNPHFARSALSRYPSEKFVELVRAHGIAFHEKKLGQLFCDVSAQSIVALLRDECAAAGAEFALGTRVTEVARLTPASGMPAVGGEGGRFRVRTSHGDWTCASLVVATGGLSIPKVGATGLGYEIARQFGLALVPTEPALDGFTFGPEETARCRDLAGLSIDCQITSGGVSFRENILFTHSGLSGPAALQASLHWRAGDAVVIDCLPDRDAFAWFMQQKREGARAIVRNLLAQWLPARFADLFCALYLPPSEADRPLPQVSEKALAAFCANLHAWRIAPRSTVGYGKAEVTRGGVDTDELSSKTLGAKKIAGLYFVGEVVDVTGWLGGYNFQWAWASGWAAGQVV